MRLLMLDFDQRLVSAVTRALQEEGVEVVGVQDPARARAHAASKSFDAALLDCDLLDPNELSAFAELPVLLTTSFLEPEGEHRFFRRARLLRKPFTNAQLLAALRDSCGGPGTAAVRLVDVLRQAHSDGMTFCLRVGDAELHMERGELVHAQLADVAGESALAEVLAGPQEGLVTMASRKVERTIHRPFQALLLDLLRNLEERERREQTEVAGSVAQLQRKEPRS